MTMDHQRLRDLLDHPRPDADAARDPALTARVMERVRHAAAPRPAAAGHDAWLWGAAAAIPVAAALAVPGAGLVADGGLGAAAGLFSGRLVELAVGALIAATVLGLTRGRRQLARERAP
jgi:cytosine/uracil/thiamine/allantoin permease